MPENTIPTVKICGLQSVEVLKSILHVPIAHIGFVFAPSKRRVTPHAAAEMVAYLRSVREEPEESGEHHAGRTAPLAVGVFVNPTKEELTETLRTAPLDVVQLHGQESPDFCRWVKAHFQVQVFKVVSVLKEAGGVSRQSVSAQLDPYRGTIDAVLLDTYDPVYGGGSGKTFAWDCIPAYREWAHGTGAKLIVAGGLLPDNVSSLLSQYRPDGVDVSSGVETDGVKDTAKITAFVERVTHYGAST